MARARTGSTGAASQSGNAGRSAGVIVDVAGAVRTPGVYELPRGARVHDAISAAGGVRPGAVLTGLNRAAEVVDGQQVLIPVSTPGTGAAMQGAGGGAASAPDAKISINSADVTALDELPGIGPVTAQRIVDDRMANGPFADVADLGRVPGIGDATIGSLEPLVTP